MDEIDRWRLCILVELRGRVTDPELLLREINDVYRLFDYPPDMSTAVSYMPVEGGRHAEVGTALLSPIKALDDVIDALDARLAPGKR